MSHSSTGIEGNRLNIRQVEAIVEHKKVDAPIRDIYEVQNYLNALRYISTVVKDKRPITERTIIAIHRLVTNKTLTVEQPAIIGRGQSMLSVANSGCRKKYCIPLQARNT